MEQPVDFEDGQQLLSVENKEATQTCSKCHRDVAEVNFTLHETHCNRFLCVCPDCDETVPRDQLSQHREEQHTQVKCSKCNKKMERRHLLDHEAEECTERLLKCQFCELEVSWKEMSEHDLVCGSRTEFCKDCSHYIKLRDLLDHRSTCSAPDEGASPPQMTNSVPDETPESDNRNMGSLSTEDTEEQQELDPFPSASLDYEEPDLKEEEEDSEDDLSRQVSTAQLSSTFKATSRTKTASWGPRGDGGDPDQISTCPHCHLALPIRTLSWHQVKCQTHIFLKHSET